MVEGTVFIVNMRGSTAGGIWKNPDRESSRPNMTKRVDLPGSGWGAARGEDKVSVGQGDQERKTKEGEQKW